MSCTDRVKTTRTTQGCCGLARSNLVWPKLANPIGARRQLAHTACEAEQLRCCVYLALLLHVQSCSLLLFCHGLAFDRRTFPANQTVTQEPFLNWCVMKGAQRAQYAASIRAGRRASGRHNDGGNARSGSRAHLHVRFRGAGNRRSLVDQGLVDADTACLSVPSGHSHTRAHAYSLSHTHTHAQTHTHTYAHTHTHAHAQRCAHKKMHAQRRTRTRTQCAGVGWGSRHRLDAKAMHLEDANHSAILLEFCVYHGCFVVAVLGTEVRTSFS